MSKSKKAPNAEEVQATIRQLIQQTLREALEAELEEFLGYSMYQRSENDKYERRACCGLLKQAVNVDRQTHDPGTKFQVFSVL